MRIQVLRAEAVKLRRAPIWVAYAALPLIAAVIGTFNYQQNLDVLMPGWESLWTQHTLFELCFFLPALVGAGSSWLMRLEYAGDNWNQVLASPADYAQRLLLAWFGGVPMVAVQLAISSLVRSFSAPVGVALAGGVGGMFLSAKGLGLWWPWALMQLASSGVAGEGLASAHSASLMAVAFAYTAAVVAACAWAVGRAAASSE